MANDNKKKDSIFSGIAGNTAKAEPPPKKTPEVVIVKEEKVDGAVPWAETPFQKIDMKEFEKKMVDLGIVTYEDALKHRSRIFGILQGLYGIDIGSIMTFAREHAKK